MASQIYFGGCLKITHGALDVVVLPLLAQYELAAAEPLVVSDEIVVALETFATCVTLELLCVYVHVAAVHLLVLEHQRALLAHVALVVLRRLLHLDLH